MNIISVAILKLHLIFLILVFQRTVQVPVGEKKPLNLELRFMFCSLCMCSLVV